MAGETTQSGGAVTSWHDKHPEIAAQHNKKSYAKRMGAEFDERVTLARVARRANYICSTCGRPVYKGNMQMSHIVSYVNGGGHTWDNVRLTHKSCKKAEKVYDGGRK